MQYGKSTKKPPEISLITVCIYYCRKNIEYISRFTTKLCIQECPNLEVTIAYINKKLHAWLFYEHCDLRRTKMFSKFHINWEVNERCVLWFVIGDVNCHPKCNGWLYCVNLVISFSRVTFFYTLCKLIAQQEHHKEKQKSTVPLSLTSTETFNGNKI